MLKRTEKGEKTNIKGRRGREGKGRRREDNEKEEKGRKTQNIGRKRKGRQVQ